MELGQLDKALVLVQALPYIQKYHNKIVVVKYGGNAMIEPTLIQAVINDIVLLSLVGIRVVLVHGGGPEISHTLQRMGVESKFVGGLRYTDKETAQVAQMVLAGKTNKDLVRYIQNSGGRGLGLCGIDGGMMQAKKLQADADLGFVGDITAVDPKPVLDALNSGYLPVVAPLACDADGQVYNVNADTAAAHLAGALQAESLINMTDIRGLLRDKEDESTLIPVVQVSEVPSLVRQGIIGGGMLPKVDSCVLAVRKGVQKAIIIDGRIPHSILIEMMTDSGIGTLFHAGGYTNGG